MKPLTLLLIVCTLLCLAAVATKPGDQECINQVRSSLAAPGGDELQQVLGIIEVNRATIRIEDRIFFKQIYTFTGEHIGSAAFGSVWVNE